MVRIIRPHHPLLGQFVELVEVERYARQLYYIIELSDHSRLQIPVEWVDDGHEPLPESAPNHYMFTIKSARDLIAILTSLKQKYSRQDNDAALSSPVNSTTDTSPNLASEDKHDAIISVSQFKSTPTDPASTARVDMGSIAAGESASTTVSAGSTSDSGGITRLGGSDQ